MSFSLSSASFNIDDCFQQVDNLLKAYRLAGLSFVPITDEKARVDGSCINQDPLSVQALDHCHSLSNKDADECLQDYDYYADQQTLEKFRYHFDNVNELPTFAQSWTKYSTIGALIGGIVGLAAGTLCSGMMWMMQHQWISEPITIGTTCGAVLCGSIGAKRITITFPRDNTFLVWKRAAIENKVYHHFQAFVEGSNTLRDLRCPLSHELILEPFISTHCHQPHVFEGCLLKNHLEKSSNKAECPVCRVAMTIKAMQPYPLYTRTVADALNEQLPACENNPHIYNGMVSFLISANSWSDDKVSLERIQPYPLHLRAIAKALDEQLPACEHKPHIHKGIVAFLTAARDESNTKEIAQITSLEEAHKSGALTEVDYLARLRKVTKSHLKLKNLKNFLDSQDVQKKKNVVITAILHNVSEQAEGNLI